MKQLIILLFIQSILIGIPVISFSQTAISINPKDVKTGNLQLSDLAAQIEYIPLETNRNCLIGEIDLFDISSSYIFVFSNKSHQAYLFKRDGAFIAQIGKEGNGPGEYLNTTVTGVFIDEKNKLVIIQTRYPEHLLCYDFKGNYIKTQKAEDELNTIQIFHNDQFLVTFVNSNGRVPYIYEMRSRNLNVIQRFGSALPYKLVGAPNEGASTLIFPTVCYYVYENRLHVKQTCLNDTLFAITNNSHYPKYLLNAGKYEITPELRGDFKNFIYRIDDYVKLQTIHESKKHLLFSYIYERKFNHRYYDKEKKAVFSFNSEEGIPNNMDGGFPFWPREQRNEFLYGFYQAELFDGLKQKKRQPNRSKELVQLINKLEFDDNPVIVVVKLKE